MVASKYSRIVIIYNPKSTGDAKSKADRLTRRLKRRGLADVELKATEHAGHAEELAYRAATKHSHPLIISVSGDGGYNEVINGVMRAIDEKKAKDPVCAIFPAGNANDHRRAVKKRPLTWAVLHSKPEAIDILRLETKLGGTVSRRYAHSYIGFGMTSEAAAELNRVRLSVWKEAGIVIRTLMNYQPFTIERPDGQNLKLNNLIFANIHQMSKVIRIGTKSSLHTGTFRVIAIRHRSHIRFVWTLLSIALFGFRHPPQTDAYEFVLPTTQLVHLDAEVSTVAGGSHVRVESATDRLLTIR